MTLVNTETGEIVADCTPEVARELTDQIKVAVDVAWQLVAKAYQTGAHRALGYGSWDNYCTQEFGTTRLRLPREERQEVVASLRESGLSIRAIAAATGIDRKTVRSDMAQVVEMGPPEPTPNVTPILKGEPTKKAPPKPVTGIDGKTYARPEPKEPSAPRRPPLGDQIDKAAWDFRRIVERLERLSQDDRYPANKDKVATVLRGHLTYAVEVCQDLLDGLDH